MSTKQMEPDQDSWKDQEHRQRRAGRRRKVGAIVVAAAIAIAVVAVALMAKDHPSPRPLDPTPAEVVPPGEPPTAIALNGIWLQVGGPNSSGLLVEFPTRRHLQRRRPRKVAGRPTGIRNVHRHRRRDRLHDRGSGPMWCGPRMGMAGEHPRDGSDAGCGHGGRHRRVSNAAGNGMDIDPDLARDRGDRHDLRSRGHGHHPLAGPSPDAVGTGGHLARRRRPLDPLPSSSGSRPTASSSWMTAEASPEFHPSRAHSRSTDTRWLSRCSEAAHALPTASPGRRTSLGTDCSMSATPRWHRHPTA